MLTSSGSLSARRLLPFTSERQLLKKRCERQQGNALTCRAQADQVLRSMSDNGEVSCLVVTGTNLVKEAQKRHGTSPTASAALGRAILGTLLISSFKAEGETTQVSFRGDGIIQGLQAIAEATGQVKGSLGNPKADPPLQANGKLDVGGAVGQGVLAVVRNHPEWERPYTGIVEIASGEIAEDLAKYLVESEQQNAAIALGVSIDREAGIKAAGGFLIQILPYASEMTLTTLEQNIGSSPSMTELLHQGLTAKDITEKLLHGLGVSDNVFSMEPRYGPCEPSALQDRMKRAVALLGAEEIDRLVEEEGKIEVTCEFCKDTYQFTGEDITETTNVPSKSMLLDYGSNDLGSRP